MSVSHDAGDFDPKQHRWGYELNAPLIAVIGIAGALLMYVTVVATQAWFYDLQREAVAEKTHARTQADLAAYRQEQAEKLKGLDQAVDQYVASQAKPQ